MSIPDNTIIAATTETDYADFVIEAGQIATINAVGLAEGELVTFAILAGTTYVPCYDFDLETLLTLTSTKTPVSLRSPGRYRVTKPMTSQAVSLHLDK